MHDIGLAKWPGFLDDAAERAAAYAPARGNVVLAQATPPNTATDSSPGGAPAAATPPGRYVVDHPERWVGPNPVGTGECVPLVQAATGAPLTSEWRPGVLVQGNTAIRPGTAIATFDSNGHYTGHAAIYLGQDEHGIHVIDQWNDRDGEGRIIRQQPPHVRTISFGGQHSMINRGESYRVVE